MPEPERNNGADEPVVRQTLPVTGIRRMTAVNMQQSLQEHPQGTGFISVDMSALLELKQRLSEQGGVSVTAMFIALVAQVLKDHPLLNAARKEKKVELYESINVGFAASTPGPEYALIVPVIRDADRKDVLAISAEVREKSEKVRTKTFTMEDLTGGTYTVSSLGMFDVDGFTPILNPPQAAILAVGTTRNTPVVNDEGEVVVRPMATVSSTVDHAVVNGVPHCLFLADLRDAITHPAARLGLAE